MKDKRFWNEPISWPKVVVSLVVFYSWFLISNVFSDVYRRWEVVQLVREAVEIRDHSFGGGLEKSKELERKKAEALKHNRAIVSLSRQYPEGAIERLDLEYLENMEPLWDF